MSEWLFKSHLERNKKELLFIRMHIDAKSSVTLEKVYSTILFQHCSTEVHGIQPWLRSGLLVLLLYIFMLSSRSIPATLFTLCCSKNDQP